MSVPKPTFTCFSHVFFNGNKPLPKNKFEVGTKTQWQSWSDAYTSHSASSKCTQSRTRNVIRSDHNDDKRLNSRFAQGIMSLTHTISIHFHSNAYAHRHQDTRLFSSPARANCSGVEVGAKTRRDGIQVTALAMPLFDECFGVVIATLCSVRHNASGACRYHHDLTGN